LTVNERSQAVPHRYAQVFESSSSQRAMWFDEQFSPGTLRNNLTNAVRISVPVDKGVIRDVLQRVVDSNPSLRTTFVEVDGEPVQRIAARQLVDLEVLDVSTWSEQEVDQRLEQEHLRRYDLERGPLARFLFLNYSADEHLLVIGMHHLISDLWSCALLGHSIAVTYKSLGNETTDAVLEQDASYLEFVASERALLDSPKTAATLDFWRPSFEEWLPQELISDGPDCDDSIGLGAVHEIEVESELVDGLRKVSSDCGVPVRLVVLAAFQAVLHREHGLNQVIVAEIKANRNIRLTRVIGCCINPIVRSATFMPGVSLGEVVEHTYESALASRPHERYPFERLLHELRPGHGLLPFFSASFSWQKTSRLVDSGVVSAVALGEAGDRTVVEGFDVAPYQMPIRSAPLPLSLLGVLSGDDLRLAMEYQTQRFDAESMERFGRRLLLMLRAMVDSPHVPVDEIDLTTESERSSRRAEWATVERQVDGRLAVHHLVERQVAKSPDALAVRDASGEVTYADLNARANRLSRLLADDGVGSGDLVGICCNRSVEMIVAILAAWKCGAGYVPMDPEFPRARLKLMMSDAQVKMVVSRSNVIADLSLDVAGSSVEVFDGVVVIDVDLAADRIAGFSDSAPSIDVSDEDLAYVIFTSGSTGRPKGVAVEHRNVVNFLDSMARLPGLDASDVVLASTTLSFDISVLEIMLPLSVGAAIELVERDVVVDPTRLSKAIARVTVAQGTPTMWKMLIESGWLGHDDLTVLCGGELMSRSLADALIERCSTLWNLYGPTETTVWSAIERVQESERSVPLGEPIGNTRLYVLDGHRMVPDGVPGELWIAGRGVARGYVGRPDLTTERFEEDPFFGEGERMYRTGDLVRRRSGGDLEFLGRVDDQVKVRGHRIELGEVEAQLTKHASVTGAVVAVRDFGAGDMRLVAYYIPVAKAGDAKASTLRGHLRASLPDYMIPSAFVAIDQIPLTPNNKLDRESLPDPRGPLITADGNGLDQTEQSRDRSNDVLLSVLIIYRDVLGDEGIGPSDNFFDLGGHSLLATRLASRLRNDLDREISLREIFEHPTPGGLARVVAAAPVRLEDPRPAHEDRGNLDRMSMPTVDDTFALSHSQERMWFMQKLNPDSVAYNLAAALSVRGEVDLSAFRWALDRLVERHTALRTRFIERNGVPRLQVEEPFSVDLQLSEPGNEAGTGLHEAVVKSALDDMSRTSFDLTVSPLFRVALVRLGREEFVVGLVMHHIISDQWSFGVLTRELAELYESRRRGLRSSTLALDESRPEIYGEWCRHRLDAGETGEHLAYWREQLKDLPTVVIPTDKPRPQVVSDEGRTIVVPMPDDLLDAVRATARSENASEFMVLLAAYQLLIHRITGAVDIPVGVPIANRQWLESESLISSLVNTLVIRTDLSGASSFQAVLRRVRDVTLDAYEHQETPFERLVQELVSKRDLSRSPLFQLFFNVQNAPFEMPEIQGLQFEVLHLERQAAQFDISLTVDTALTSTLTLEYAVDLFDDARMQTFVDEYLKTLKEAVFSDEPFQAVDEVSPTYADDAAGVRRPVLHPVTDVKERPRSGIERQLAAIWEDVLGVSVLNRCDDFFDLGGHSLLAVRMLAEVNRLTDRKLPMATLFRAPTVAEFAALLESGGWLTPWTSLVEIHAGERRQGFFCVAPFRVTALSFNQVARNVGEDVPFYVLQPQGLERDDPIHQSVPEMARHYVREIKTVQPEGPYVIGGHCSGGWVALEMARQLQTAGDRVEKLIVIDVEPPGIVKPKINWTRYVVSRTVLYIGSGRLLSSLSWQVRMIWERRRVRQNSFDGQERMRRVRSAHAQAHRQYLGGSFEGDLHFVRSEEWSRLEDKDWHLRWSSIVSGQVEVTVVPGPHSEILDGESAISLADTIQQTIKGH